MARIVKLGKVYTYSHTRNVYRYRYEGSLYTREAMSEFYRRYGWTWTQYARILSVTQEYSEVTSIRSYFLYKYRRYSNYNGILLSFNERGDAAFFTNSASQPFRSDLITVPPRESAGLKKLTVWLKENPIKEENLTGFFTIPPEAMKKFVRELKKT